MKKIKLYLSGILILVLIGCIIHKTPVFAASKRGINSLVIKSANKIVTKKTIYIKRGTSIKLVFDIKPLKNMKSIDYKSNNRKVAIIINRRIRTKRTGSARIRISITGKDGKTIKSYVNVKVVKSLPANTINGTYKNSKKDNKKRTVKKVNKKSPVKKVILNSTTLKMDVGSKKTLVAGRYTDNVRQNTTFSWSSSNSQIVSVYNGIIIGVSKGQAIITATSADGIKATCKVQVSENTSSDWLSYQNVFLYSAHRGAVVKAPENTILAVREAINLKYGVIEIDPRMSADGTFYLMHDSTVDRTTNGQGELRYMTDQEIDTLLVNKDNYPELTDDIHVAKFEDALALISKSKLLLNIDGSKMDYSSTEIVDSMINLLKKYDMLDRTFFVITNETQREAFHKRYPNVCLSWLYNPNRNIKSDVEKIKAYPRAMLSITASYATKDRLQILNESGIYYQVYNVESASKANELKKQGVPMIETNSLIP